MTNLMECDEDREGPIIQMSKLAPPSTLYGILPGHTGFTEEWGRIKVIRKRGGIVWFEATGGRGKPGVYSHTRSYLFHSTNWDLCSFQ